MTHPKQALLTHIAPPPLNALVLLSGPTGGSGIPGELYATLPTWVVVAGQASVACQALGGLWADHDVSCGRDSRHHCGRRLDVLLAGPRATQLHACSGACCHPCQRFSPGSPRHASLQRTRTLSASFGKPTEDHLTQSESARS